MPGSRRGAGRAPAEPEPQRPPGCARFPQVPGEPGAGEGRGGPAGGAWVRAPAPLRVPAPQRRRHRESRPRRLCAASIPAALPALAAAAQQTMNLRARRAEAGLGPVRLRAAPAVPGKGGPSPPVVAVLRRLRAPGPTGRMAGGCARARASPSPAGVDAAGAGGPGTGRRGGGAAGSPRPAGGARVGPGSSAIRGGGCGRKTDGPTARRFRLASAWGGGPGAGGGVPRPGARSAAHFGEVSGAGEAGRGAPAPLPALARSHPATPGSRAAAAPGGGGV